MTEIAEQPMYSPEQQRQILRIVRQALTLFLSGQRMAPPQDCPDWLQEPRGCFVTLHNRNHELRGCIGTFRADAPLIHTLIEMAGAAARDPRFTAVPVRLEELADLQIEVSVLSPLQPMKDPRAMRLGVDGIYLTEQVLLGGRRSGCFLPQVATEQGWNVEQMLGYCCSHKMGLAYDAWQTSRTMEFFRFQCEVMNEPQPGGLDAEPVSE